VVGKGRSPLKGAQVTTAGKPCEQRTATSETIEASNLRPDVWPARALASRAASLRP